MLLRASGEKSGDSFNLAAVTGVDNGVVGVAGEDFLLALTDAVVLGDDAEIATLRAEGIARPGAQAMVDAMGVAAAFNGITRVANATGIPLDETTEGTTVEMRETTQIDSYADAAKANKYTTDPDGCQ